MLLKLKPNESVSHLTRNPAHELKVDLPEDMLRRTNFPY